MPIYCESFPLSQSRNTREECTHPHSNPRPRRSPQHRGKGPDNEQFPHAGGLTPLLLRAQLRIPTEPLYGKRNSDTRREACNNRDVDGNSLKNADPSPSRQVLLRPHEGPLRGGDASPTVINAPQKRADNPIARHGPTATYS